MNPIITKSIDFYYINSKQDLNLLVDVLKQQTILAVDTETYIDLTKLDASALDPHSSLISLIQVNYPNNKVPYIIDVISIGIQNCCRFIQEIMLNEQITKIFHNASFDIAQFKGTFGIWIKNVECTMILARSLAICCGYKASLFRGHSLKDLVRDYFSVHLDKGEATSLWGARPLNKQQLIYAALDVGAVKDGSNYCYVLEAYDTFTSQLKYLKQEIAYTADLQAMYVSSKIQYEGLYVDKEILTQTINFAEQQTDKHRTYLVKELGFTIYTELDINSDGELKSVNIIPDKIKTLLNNNKGLVEYINAYLKKTGSDSLSSLQAQEVKIYLDRLEKEVDIDTVEGMSADSILNDEEYLEAKYAEISLIKALLNYKKYSKLLSEANKYLDIINPNTGCVHARFLSVGSSTGRMSSSGDLNLQQVSNVRVNIDLAKNKL